MNILYQTCGKLNSTSGGTERTTITMAEALAQLYGVRCFSIYERIADTPKENCIVAEFQWSAQRDAEINKKALRKIIVENDIDFVIIQGAFIHVSRFKTAAEGTKCKIIFAHHFEPRWELVFGHFGSLIHYRPKSVIDFMRWMKWIVTYPRTAMNREKVLSAQYRAAYECAHRVVLLSKGFIKPYSEFAKLQDTSKFTIIPNRLSFNLSAHYEDLTKHKVVLIVSRLDETQKRLSLALRIWKKVKQNPVADGWVMKIVGHGGDYELCENIIKNEDIPAVTLEGRQDPIPYYKEASIFMMTSRSEAWGLTLTEAQQMGVVPIAFDTYASLRDIITDGVDGEIIAEGDVDGYVRCVLNLMQDDVTRQRMARQAIASSQRFSQEKIAGMWKALFDNLG